MTFQLSLRSFVPALLLAALLAAGGCDSSFEPYADTDLAFSVFGALSPGDEVHRVRVEPLQDGQPFSADSTLDATVTLAHPASGREVTLEKEVLAFQGIKLNYVTDEMDLELDERYRLTVRRSDGAASTATFRTPHEIPDLTLTADTTTLHLGLTATVEGGTEDRLFFLIVDYRVVVDGMEQILRAAYHERATPTETGYTASLTWEPDVRSFFPSSVGPDPILITLIGVDVQAGLVHPGTPDYEGLTYEELFSPGVGPSNVENGYGLVVGVADDFASVALPFGKYQITIGG